METLAWKADMVYRRINSIPGVSCNSVQGAMYAFPKIEIPAAALEDARVSSTSTHLPAAVQHVCACMYMHFLALYMYNT